jgi:hypothetical protein
VRKHSKNIYQFSAKLKLFEILCLKHEFEGTLRLLLKVVLAIKYINIGAKIVFNRQIFDHLNEI